MEVELTPRQLDILRRVVESYVATGRPVGSKSLVAGSRLGVSASTVRNELAELEGLGLLTHPHTSAGRVPTEAGYRVYVDGLLDRLEPRPAALPLDFAAGRSEVEVALRETTEMLSRFTRLLALASAPPLETTTVRHVEVLLLQPQVVVVVVITSTGEVTKRTLTFGEPVDPGLAKWADDYLNERVAGLQLGSHVLRQRFSDPGLSPRERAFLELIAPTFTELVRSEERLFVGGAAGLLARVRPDELEACRRVLEALEQRATLLGMLGEALDPRRPFVRVGLELENAALRNVSLVGASYGLTGRTLGAVSLLGPVRMDYDKAIRSVRAAAHELSRFVAGVYEEN
jgi:heat-inducible transcriptional repressor